MKGGSPPSPDESGFGEAEEVIIKMEKMMKECMKPHALLHIVSGTGLGLLLAGLFGGAAGTLGVILLLGGLIADVMMQKK